MHENVNDIHQASLYAAEADNNHYALGQWRGKFDDWLAGDDSVGMTQRTCQWIFGHILTQKQRAPYDVVDGWLSKGLPTDLNLGGLFPPEATMLTMTLVGNAYAPRYLELHRYPESGLAFIALSWLLGRTTQSYGTIAGTLAFSKWEEFDTIFLSHLNKRRNDEGMDYANFVLATISVICWRYLEANREMADGIYNDYFKQKTQREKKLEARVAAKPTVEESIEVAVEELDNTRTVGAIVEAPTDGTIRIRGIGTPELSVEVEPVRDAWKNMEPDMAGAEIAHNLDYHLSQHVGNWRKNAALELMERDSFPSIEQSIVHIYADLVGKRGTSGSEFIKQMIQCGFSNPEMVFSSEAFHGTKATYWLCHLAKHFKIVPPAPLVDFEAELYIAMCLLFQAHHRHESIGKASWPFFDLVEIVAPRPDVIYDEVYDYVMLHALCGCVALLRANAPLAGNIYRMFIGFRWNDFPMESEVEKKPAPKVLIKKDDVALGELPVPHPVREDSLARELERVTLEALSKPGLHIHKEGRREAGVEPETHATLTGNVDQQAKQLEEVLAGVPRPTSITIALNPDEDADAQLAELINRFGTRPEIKKHHGPEVLPILKVLPTNEMHESIMKKVTRKKRGWLTGKFCMLHMGHINFIHQAATQCDELVVVLSHSDKRFKDPRLSYRNKMLWLRTTFKNEPHITVVGIDESNIPEYPNGWEAWSDLVKEKIGTDFDYIFTSEICDHSGYNTHFPGQEVRVVDPERKGVDISATRIREDMVQHWGMMPTVVRKDFVMRICIVGTESCGKTSLTKMLAKRNQTSWVEEYGRTYCEQDLCMDEDLLEFDDYGTIAARRYDMEQEAAAAANRVLFVDTAALSTNYFCLLYEGRENTMVSAYQERERYDAYFYLTDDVPFVEDGLRKNRNRDNTRFLFEKMLFANAKRHGSEVFVISGNYNERFNKANEIVDELLARPLSLV